MLEAYNKDLVSAISRRVEEGMAKLLDKCLVDVHNAFQLIRDDVEDCERLRGSTHDLREHILRLRQCSDILETKLADLEAVGQ